MEVNLFDGIDDDDPLQLLGYELSELRKVADAGNYRLIVEPAEHVFGSPPYARLEWVDGQSGRSGSAVPSLGVFRPFQPFGYRTNTTAPIYVEAGGGLSIPDAQFLGRRRQASYDDLMDPTLRDEVKQLLDRKGEYVFSDIAAVRDVAFLQLERCAARLAADTENGPGPLPGIASTLRVWLAEVEVASPGQLNAAAEYAARVWEALTTGWRAYEAVRDEAATMVGALASLGTGTAISKAIAFGLVTFIERRDLILREAARIEPVWAAAERILHAELSGGEALPEWPVPPDPFELIPDQENSWYEFTKPIMFWLDELRNPFQNDARETAYEKVAPKIGANLGKRYADILNERTGVDPEKFGSRQLGRVIRFAEDELGMKNPWPGRLGQ